MINNTMANNIPIMANPSLLVNTLTIPEILLSFLFS